MMQEPFRTWLHPQECTCDTCAPFQLDPPPALGAVAIARLAITGFCAGGGLCALLDPHTTLVALAAIVGIGL